MASHSSNIRLLKLLLELLLSTLTLGLDIALDDAPDNTDELNLNPPPAKEILPHSVSTKSSIGDIPEDCDALLKLDGLKEKELGCMIEGGIPFKMSGCKGLEDAITANLLQMCLHYLSHYCLPSSKCFDSESVKNKFISEGND